MRSKNMRPETESEATTPQREEGITACRWESFESAFGLVAYENAREVLKKASTMVNDGAAPS